MNRRYKGRHIACLCTESINSRWDYNLAHNFEHPLCGGPMPEFPTTGKYADRCPKCFAYPWVLYKGQKPGKFD